MGKINIRLSSFLFLFMLFLIAVSYSNTLISPFILDDFSAFINDKKLFIDEFSLDSFQKLLNTRFGARRIIPVVTFAWNHLVSKGESIIIYHVTNISIHLLTTISIAFFLTALFKTRGARNSLVFFQPAYFILAVCSLWALAPVQTNAVTYIVQRMTSLATLFYMFAITSYIHSRISKTTWLRFSFFIVFLFSSICGFLSKENAVTIPAAVLLLEFMFISPDLAQKLYKAARWYHWLFFVIIIIVLLPFFERPWEWATGGFGSRHFTMSERLYTELRIVVFYISLLILPLPNRLNLDHDFGLSTSLLSPPSTLIALFFLSGILCIGIINHKKLPLISFGIIWFFLNLVLESTFIPLELIFEHRLYLPSIGFFLAGISFADQLLGKYAPGSHPEIKKIVFLGFLILISISSILTTTRNSDWQEAKTLYLDSYKKSPNKSRALTNYAMALGRSGDYDGCIKYGRMSLSIGQEGYENYLNSVANTLSCFMLQDKSQEAIEFGEQFKEQLLNSNLTFIEAGNLNNYMFNMGRAYTEQKQYKKALANFQIALFRSPQDPRTYQAINKLLLYVQEDELEGKQIKIGNEKYEIPIYLFKLSIKYRQYKQAKLYLDYAVEMDAGPELLETLREELDEILEKNRQKAYESNIVNNLTYKEIPSFRLYLRCFDFIFKYYKPLKGAPAGWLLSKAESIDQENPFLPVYRARWYAANKETDKAIGILEEYLKNDGGFVPALELLGEYYKKKKEIQLSVAVFKQILGEYPGHRKWRNYLSYIYKYEDIKKQSKRTPLDYY